MVFEGVDPPSKSCVILNQFLGISKEVRGEGIVGVGVSCLGDFEVSPFSDFVKDRVNFF